MSLLVQIVVSLLALGSVYLAGKKKLAAWPLLVLGHGIALGYFLLTKQYGLAPLSLGMITVGARNWSLWRNHEHLGSVRTD